jgi:threonylcarbamoyladenosine tRNA methylthiotransferase MtaB
MPLTTLTFGCRLNASESAVMRERAGEAGLEDAILVNTCAVTAEAVRQARQAIRKARRDNPGRRIIVSGCAAQIEPETFAEMPEVDLVLGNAEKLTAEAYEVAHRPRPGSSPTSRGRGTAGGGGGGGRTVGSQPPPPPPRFAWSPSPAAGDGGGTEDDPATEHEGLSLDAFEKVRVSDIFAVRESAPHLLDGFPTPQSDGSEQRVRAFVEVQNGCDHRCTFCIIPYGRGNSRSVPMGAVVDQVRRLVEAGTREAVLTGVDLTSYGADLPGGPRLGRLVRSILRHVPELPRLRISSIDSIEADPELVAAIAEEERLMPHLHLSLQAGDDMILKRMKRRHERADAVRFCEDIRRRRPDVVLGADLIAGFPTETDAMFANTLSLVEDCGLTLLHVFPFSPRNGTPAARMPQLPGPVIRARAKALRDAAEDAYRSRLAGERGALRRILVETAGFGRTEHYLPARVDRGRPGEVISARIAGIADNMLQARAIREAA